MFKSVFILSQLKRDRPAWSGRRAHNPEVGGSNPPRAISMSLTTLEWCAVTTETKKGEYAVLKDLKFTNNLPDQEKLYLRSFVDALMHILYPNKFPAP